MKENYKMKFGKVCLAVGLAIFGGAISAQSLNHSVDAFPGYTGPSGEVTTQPDALWDIQLDVNATSSSAGTVGQAGVIFLKNSQLPNGEFWTSKWASDTLMDWDANGNFVSKFQIAGLSGTRAFTWDGRFVYAGTNTTTIYRIDPVTRTLAPPHITSSGPDPVRHISYDPTLNGGSGGFWVGNFGTDITAIGLNGAVISGISSGTHGLTGMYGSAFDNYTAGGPYLWVFSQSGTNTTQLDRVTLATGQVDALSTHDVFTDFSSTNSLTGGLAGGLNSTFELVNGKASLIGVIQGTPNNVLFAYELTDYVVSRVDPVLGVRLYPTPTTDKFKVTFPDLMNADLNVKVTNMVGQAIQSFEVNPSLQPVLEVDLTGNAPGVYFVKVTNGEHTTTLKTVLTR